MRKRLNDLPAESVSQAVDADAYFSMAEQASDGILLAQDNIVAYINPRMSDMLGIARHEVTGANLRDDTFPANLNRLGRLIPDQPSSEKINTVFTTQITKKTGEIVDLEFTYGVASLKGRPAHLLIARDTSNRQYSTRRLKESEERYRIIFESANDAIFTMREDRFIECNSKTLEMFECTRKQILGEPPYRFSPRLQPCGNTSKELALQYIQRAFNGEPLFFEWTHTRFDGTPFEAEVSLNRVELNEEMLLQAIVRDISLRKNAEKEQRNAEDKMRQTQKLESLGILAGGIAHDFNNLLMGILGNADLVLRRLPESDPSVKNLTTILVASQRAADLSKQMLAYSGKGAFVVKALHLNDIVKEMKELLEVSISKSIRLEFQLADALPPIEADATQMRQVMMNLITNASEAIVDDTGVITVVTAAVKCDRTSLSSGQLDDELPEGTYVSCRVSDDGVGMDDATREKIFDPFFSTKFTGRGLGLAAVQGIVRGHKGTIRVASTLNEGTEFEILLPTSAASPEARANDNITGPVETGNRSAKSVLIIDDEKTVLTTTKQMLTEYGYHVLTAEDGHSGLEIFEKNADDISVVLLDLTMPKMGGEDTLAQIRKIRKNARIILMSGYNEQDIADRFPGDGPNELLEKPFGIASLIKKIERQFGE